MATLQETLTPDFNVPFGIRTALSIDRTMLVPTSRVLSPELSACRDFEQIVPSLRAAGVTRVLSLEPLNHPSLMLLSEVAPARTAPLMIRVYGLSEPLPRFSQPVRIVGDTPNHLSIEAVVEHPAQLTIREPFARRWRATINGKDAPILRNALGHRELSLPKGRSEIQMSYEPPGLRTGIGITVIASLVCGLLPVQSRGSGL